MKVGSLFSGIEGLGLGLERAGMKIVWQAENDPYCSKVLAKHWPHVPNLGDVTKIKWEEVERVDLVCGGFPCQPFSSAGLQQGEADARYLWPEVVRCIRVLRPRFLLLENVTGLLTSPEFGHILSDLSDSGFHAAWDVLPAAIFGAPHRRFRLFVIAHTDREGFCGFKEHHCPAFQAFAEGVDRYDLDGLDVAQRRAAEATAIVRRMDDGPTPRLDTARLHALGNAVVPQIAEFLGLQLLQHIRQEVA